MFISLQYELSPNIPNIIITSLCFTQKFQRQVKSQQWRS